MSRWCGPGGTTMETLFGSCSHGSGRGSRRGRRGRARPPGWMAAGLTALALGACSAAGDVSDDGITSDGPIHFLPVRRDDGARDSNAGPRAESAPAGAKLVYSGGKVIQNVA